MSFSKISPFNQWLWVEGWSFNSWTNQTKIVCQQYGSASRSYHLSLLNRWSCLQPGAGQSLWPYLGSVWGSCAATMQLLPMLCSRGYSPCWKVMHVASKFKKTCKILKGYQTIKEKKWKVGKFVKFAKWTPLTYLHGLCGIVFGLGGTDLG